MSTNEEAADFQFPAISKPAFLGLVWGSLGVSAAFLLFRAYVRLSVFKRFFIDDGPLLFAWILLLISVSLWQSMIDDLYVIFRVTVGMIPPPANMLDIVWRYFRCTFAVSLLNIFTLWSIKASFLAFFYQLGNKVKGHKMVWWIAAAAWLVGLAISVGVQNFKCTIGSREEAIAACSTIAYGQFIYRSLRLQAACDVITDAFIMAIPIQILWHVQISTHSKIGLMLLFALIFFTMIIAIIRVTLSLRNEREDDTWIYVWPAIESAVGIMVASAISYRALVSRERRKQTGYTGDTEQRNLRHGTRHGATGSHDNDSAVHAGKTSLSKSSLGQEEAVPLDAIRVQRDYDVVPEVAMPQDAGEAELKK